MPIRLNLLAEAQAAEDLRRRDPVKRAIWLGCLLVAGMLVWSFSIYVSGMLAKAALASVEGSIGSRTNEYNQALKSQSKSAEIKNKLIVLRQLSTNRFLNGNLMDALQKVTVDDVQLMRLKVEQLYLATEEVKAKTNSEGRLTGARPATVKETIKVVLEARDSAPLPGDQVNKFKDLIATNAYFQGHVSKTNGVRLSFVGSPTALPDSKPFVLFTVECLYPEQTR